MPPAQVTVTVIRGLGLPDRVYGPESPARAYQRALALCYLHGDSVAARDKDGNWLIDCSQWYERGHRKRVAQDAALEAAQRQPTGCRKDMDE